VRHELNAGSRKLVVKLKASRLVNRLTLLVGPDFAFATHRAAHFGARAMQMGLHHPAIRLLRLH